MATFKRRRLVVDRKLQYSFVIVSFSYFVLTVLVLGTTLFLPLVIDLYNAKMSVSKLGLVADKILYLNKMFWPAMVLLVVLILCHTIYQTHKITGPLYRFRRVIGKLTQGDLLSNFKLRKGDYLYPEMVNLNGLIDELRARVSGMKADQEKVAVELSKALGDAGSDLPPGLAEALGAAAEANSRLAEKLDYFRTEAEPDPDAD